MRINFAALTKMIAARPQSGDMAAAPGVLDLSDPWMAAGLGASIVLTICLLWQWISSARQKRFVVPVGVSFAAFLATLVLVAYALNRGEPVFIAAQSLAAIVAFRIYLLSRQIRRRHESAAQLTFPRVSPETAERKYTEGDSRTGISSRAS